MKNVIAPRQEVGGGSPRSLVSRGLSSARARRVLRRVFPWVPAGTLMDGGQDKSSASQREMTGLAAQLYQYQKEEKQFRSEQPFALGTGVIAEIVPPIAGEPVRSSVGSPSMAGYLVSGDAWQIVLSRFLKENSKVLDIGCGCGKMARNLSYHPYIKRYIGFDVIKTSIDWCLESIVPRTGGRFEFHWIDVYSETYNPQGKVRGTEVVFPAADGSIDLAFASSLFTHLLQEDAKNYLREVRRVLAPNGLFLPTIHNTPLPGTSYSGNEARIDIDPDYFVKLAEDAGLRLIQRLGDLCGQEAFLFTAGSVAS